MESKKSAYLMRMEMEGKWPSPRRIRALGDEISIGLKAAIDVTMAEYDLIPTELLAVVDRMIGDTTPSMWLYYSVRLALHRKLWNDIVTDKINASDEAGQQLLGQRLSPDVASKLGTRMLGTITDMHNDILSEGEYWYADVEERVTKNMDAVLGQYVDTDSPRIVHLRKGNVYEVVEQGTCNPRAISGTTPLRIKTLDGTTYGPDFGRLVAAMMIRYPLSSEYSEIGVSFDYVSDPVW